MPATRRIRPFLYNPWASRLADAEAWLAALPGLDIAPLTSDPMDAKLQRLGRLDCDWQGECTRCFSRMQHKDIEFLPARVLGRTGMADLIGESRPADEEWWYITYGQHPQGLEKLAAPAFAALRKKGLRICYYSFDEASRTMPCFAEIAPFLSLLIHDEAPLDPRGQSMLRQDCRTVHMSWVANLLPFEAPFNEAPEERIIFLGSEMGLTPNRRAQVEFLKEHFKDRFLPFHDHSVSVGSRLGLNRYKVSLCPEGRKFVTSGMARTHTDRPFWSGCLGMMPVSENSRQGGRLDELAAEGLLVRYPHGDLKALAGACEEALAADTERRRRIHAHFNSEGTVGTVISRLLAAMTA
jgi:hypothetical protein